MTQLSESVKNKVGKPKKDRGYGGKPNTCLVLGLRIFLWFWFLRFHPKCDKSDIQGMKGPYILIVNHPSNIDAFIIGRVLNPIKTNFVASQHFFKFPILRFLLSLIGAIPKSHSAKDIQSLRLMMHVLKAGRILVIFPEGRRTMDGTGSQFSPAMAKFVKKSKVPVVSATIQGSYIAWPRWAEKARPGPVSVVFRRVMSTEEVVMLTLEEIHDKMLKALQFNEFASNAVLQNQYKCKAPARNIEWLLHACPDCRQEECMTAKDDIVRCSSCGASVRYAPSGKLEQLSGTPGAFQDIPSWFLVQRNLLADKMNDANFAIQATVSSLSYTVDPEQPMKVVGAGKVLLTREHLAFVGQINKKETALHFPIALLDMLPCYLGKYFEICDENGEDWHFDLEDGRKVVQLEQFVSIAGQAR